MPSFTVSEHLFSSLDLLRFCHESKNFQETFRTKMWPNIRTCLLTMLSGRFLIKEKTCRLMPADPAYHSYICNVFGANMKWVD